MPGQKVMPFQCVMRLVSPSVVQRSPTVDGPSEIIYVIVACVVSLKVIVVLNVYLRRRYSRRAIPINAPRRVQKCTVTEITKSLLDTIPIVSLRDPHNDEGHSSKEGQEMGTLARDSHESRDTRAHHHQESQSSPLGVQYKWTDDENLIQVNQDTNGNILHNLSNELANTICPICTESFTKAQDLRQLPCGHQFHPDCVNPWLLNRSSTCPMCRSDLMSIANAGRDVRVPNQPSLGLLTVAWLRGQFLGHY